MFAGLVLTSLSAAMLPAALFQRKSRSGWLEELDEIREDALDHHEGGVANVVDAEDIWTDLRDGGEYEDPHEISSLYATDDTPDRPVAKAAPKAGRSPRAKAKQPPKADASAPPPPPISAAPQAAPPQQPSELAPPPPAPPVVAPEVAPAAAAGAAPADGLAPEGAGQLGPQYDDQIWVQPAPHPIRPSEMWHPAELAPVPLGEESYETVTEERVASADLMDPTYHPRHEPVPVAEVVAGDERTAEALEADLAARADAAVIEPSTAVGNLVAGPVGRRVRRDRPTDRLKGTLPTPEAHLPIVDRGEQSPLPSPALPPAALPTRSNRLPAMDLPATPSSVVPPRPAPPTTEPVTEAVTEAVIEPVVEPVVEPAAVVEPAPVPAAAPIAIGDDGLVSAPGTIVRIGGDRRARAVGSPDGVLVALERGWCWASPGDGAAAPLRIDLPTGALAVEVGATALAIVEADGSAFVVVAAGSGHLERAGDAVRIERGTIVMIDPSGAAQIDAATDAEIESDPIVAENLALDAEL